MNSIRNISYFKKLLVSYMFIVLIPTFIISAVYFYYASLQLKESMSAGAKMQLEKYSGFVEMTMAELERLSLQFSLNPLLNTVLIDPQYDAFNYSQLQTSLQQAVSLNHLLYSVYFYTALNNRVLSTADGVYSVDNFYDREILMQSFNNKMSRYEPRTLRTVSVLGSTEQQVMTFSRTVPFTAKEPYGVLVFNVRTEDFFRTVQALTEEQGGTYYIVDRNGQIMYPRAVPLPFQLPELAQREKLSEAGDWDPVDVNGRRYFANYHQVSSTGWTIVKLTSDEEYAQALRKKQMNVLAVVVVVTVLFLLLACFLSFLMYVPLKRMVAGIKEVFKLTDEQHKGKDEYGLIHTALAQMMNENDRFKAAVTQNQPIIRERLVNDIFNRNPLPASALEQDKLKETGIDFPFPYFLDCVVFIDLRAYRHAEDVSSVKLFVFSALENMFTDEFRIAGTVLDDARLGFIMNTKQPQMNGPLREQLTRTCYDIIDMVVGELEVPLQFVFGRIYSSLQEMNASSGMGFRSSTYSAFLDQVDVVFAEDFRQADEVEYPALYTKRLLVHMKAGNRTAVQQVIDHIFDMYVSSVKYSQEKLLDMLVIVLSVVTHELQQEGVEWNRDSDLLLTRMNDARNKHEMKRFVERYVYRMMDGLEKLGEASTNQHIVRAIEYMKEHFERDFSIREVADHLQISTSYLNRVFKTEIGKTPLEYLTAFRMERAKQYLGAGSVMSLQEISAKLGYNDIHSFIRFFKRYEGTTPGEYRNALMRKS